MHLLYQISLRYTLFLIYYISDWFLLCQNHWPQYLWQSFWPKCQTADVKREGSLQPRVAALSTVKLSVHVIVCVLLCFCNGVSFHSEGVHVCFLVSLLCEALWRKSSWRLEMQNPYENLQHCHINTSGKIKGLILPLISFHWFMQPKLI